MEKNNQAKFAFFYILSLISLVSLATAVGNIIFQIINKNVVDVLNEIRGSYSSSALRFAISSMIISAPVFFFSAGYINKSLFKGVLDKDSQIRRWLSYLILLISFMVMSGWVIGVIFSFLDGEITTKFVLKALTALGLSAIIFSYYFYDLRRSEVVGKKDRVISIYFYSSLSIVIISLISAFVFVETPSEARMRKIDNEILQRLNTIHYSLERYHDLEQELPNNLEALLDGRNLIKDVNLYNPRNKEMFEYRVIEESKYEICAEFMLTNKELNDNSSYAYLSDQWPHDSGRQCFEKVVMSAKEVPQVIR